ncbi:MAG TPA: DMT family transporter [Povalibacter sp.]
MNWRAWVTFAVLCILWGVPYFFIKIALLELSPVCVAWTRITLAAAILLPIAWKRGVLRAALRHKGAILAFAVAELVFPFFLIALGEQWVSSSFAGILVATVPLTVVAIAPFFGVSERMSPQRIAGLAIGFAGVMALLGLDTGHGPMLWAGVAAIAVSVIGYAVGPLIVQRYLADVDELGALSLSLVVASIVLLPFALVSAPAQMPTTVPLAAVVILGVFCTALALLLYFYLINAAGAARASLVAYVCPAVAALLGVLVLHEHFGVSSFVGLVMILSGSWLASRKEQVTAAGLTVDG